MNKVLAKIEDCEFSTREYFFVGVILLLGGLLLGLVLSPKGQRTIGSHNGNNNGNNSPGCFAADIDEEDKTEC